MKRFVYAAGAVLLTGVLILLAMAVAQRDSRVSDATTDESQLPYANSEAEPISMVASNASINAYESNESWPPAPIVRANDSGLGSTLPPAVGGTLPITDRISVEKEVAATPVSLTSYANEREQAESQALAEPPALTGANGFPPTLATAPLATAQLTTPLPMEPSLSPFSSPPPIATFGVPTLPGNEISGNGPPLPSFSTPRPSPILPTGALPAGALPTGALPTNPLPAGALLSSSLPSNAMPNNALPPSGAFPSSNSFRESAATSPSYNSPLANSFSPNALPSVPASFASMPESNWFSSAAPGGRQLDGSQNPSMEIQKRAPNEVQVGQPATFTIMVRNVGTATAYDVNVVDSVPKGAKLVRTSPQAQSNGSNGLVWKLGEMPAGSEQVLTLELIPETEGEIGSVASVNFAAQASVRTMSTQPKLVVKQLLDPLVLGGDSIRIMIEISNVGTGTARDVRLQEDVPDNMRHSTGSKALELTLGDLAPGESEKRDIELTAVSAGKVRNVLRAISENTATSESSADVEVVLPKLDLAIEGAGLRYLERQVTYALHVSNSGTAMAKNVEILVYLPSGLQFNSTINEGAYLPSQHAVRWELAELAAGAKAVTEVTLLPVEEGNFVLRMQSQADGVRAETAQKPVRVEGQSELTFTIEDDNDPIETDGKTTYIVKISNIGTRVDKNVELTIDLPDGAIVEQIDAPVDYKVSQRNVVFAPISQIQAKDQHAVRLSVRHTREGTHVVRAQLKSQLRSVAVSKEESTQVYLDR